VARGALAGTERRAGRTARAIAEEAARANSGDSGTDGDQMSAISSA
jgi:hypothetical protein